MKSSPVRLFGCSGPVRRSSSSYVPIQLPGPISSTGSVKSPGSVQFLCSAPTAYSVWLFGFVSDVQTTSSA